MTKRPNVVKVFASQAVQGEYLPVKFGTNTTVMKDKYTDIANKNFEYGLESLEKDFQLKDLNSIFFYYSTVLKYLFEQGVPQYSPYQSYQIGSVVTFDGNLWIAAKEVPAQLTEEDTQAKSGIYDDCTKPSEETGWYSFVTHHEYKTKIAELEEASKGIHTSIKQFKGIKDFSVRPNPLNQALELALVLENDISLSVPMTNFGKFEEVLNDDTKSYKVTNPDGSIINIPANRASVKLMNSKGSTIGFTHLEDEKQGNPTKIIKLVQVDELNAAKGIQWNEGTQQWEVALNDLIKSNGGLIVDHEGKFSIDPVYTETRDKVITEKVKEVSQELQQLQGTVNGTEATVKVTGAITGNGSTETPLTLSLGEDLHVVGGKLTLKHSAPKAITNVLNQEFKYGLHTFTGVSNTTTGLPTNIDSTEIEESPATGTINSPSYDYNGYYIASANQIDIWLSGKDNSAWKITNEDGITPEGRVVNTGAWGKWQKLDNNSNLTNVQVTSLQQQVNGLGTQLTALQKEIEPIKQLSERVTKLDGTCKVNIKKVTGNYTILDTDNTVIVDSTSPVTITLDPDTVSVGSVVTVVQANTGSVTFTSTSPSTLHAPLEGKLIMAGKDAVVSILFEQDKHVRIMGQTQ